MSPLVHFDCAQVVIDEDMKTKEDDGIIYPFKNVRVITVNGQIWAKNFFPFGLDETRVRTDWDKRELHTWRKIEQ